MLTLKIKYCFENESDMLLVHDYMNQYNHMFRVAYNKLYNDKQAKQSELSTLNNTELLDSWFVISAIYDAKSLYGSKKDEKVIFGGRNNFIKRCQGKITREEFQQKRLSPLCSVGERKSGTKSVHGNRKFKLSDDLSFMTFKANNKKIKLNLCRLKPSYKNKLVEIYKHQVLDDTPITYKLDLNYVYITVDEKIFSEKSYKHIENRVFAVDLNPNYVGWSVVDWVGSDNFNVVASGVVSTKEINDIHFSLKNEKLSSNSNKRIAINNKRVFEIYEITKLLVNKALHYKCSIFSMEELNIESSDKGKGKRYNSLCNNLWNRKKMRDNLLKRCNIYNIVFQEVKPNYSSFVGNFLFRDLKLPDMVLASIEISRRGYEFYNQYVSKKKEIQKNIIHPNVEDFYDRFTKSLEEFGLSRNFNNLVDVYAFLKNSKMMYRVSLDSLNPKFCRLKSNKSLVKVCDFCNNS